ncbi:hypothetical protein KZ483_23930 [Paenibacillus sp. sptzw28]|uniref:hypothetical protein n=1 Tax=Paenibacillus sp. sptzw28 TaxID=715179 RepID=UPI001C6F0C94|nr:hypothetical protein [Paenibacillus sp. sptzw28]QYR20772.1 hypothetical protein KZ483_23930 [Paenibacillus sp. sptzw28]
MRSVQIDGEYPFFQAKKIEFGRMWRESGKTWFDNQGNEFNPSRKEVNGWQYSTPETGIKVNVNVVPAGQMQTLLLANTAGLAPDAALGVEGEVPIDFAVRNALLNLKKFPDYQEVADRFRPGALICAMSLLTGDMAT